MLHIIYRDYFVSNYIFEGVKEKSLNFIQVPALKLNYFQRIIFYLERKLKINIYPSNRFDQTAVEKIGRISSQDSILFFDFALYIDLLFIKKRVNTNSLKLWIWNPLCDNQKNKVDIKDIKSLGIAIYTFDSLTAQKFQINFLNQVYKRITMDESCKVEYDFFFIGINKGRVDKLNILANELKMRGYTFKFMIYPQGEDAYPNIEYLDKLISCEEALEFLKKAKIVVELLQENQVGMTLRILEGVMLGKKILTNNASVKESDLYNPANIFIWGERSWEDLDSFVTSEFVRYDRTVLSKYVFDIWINNFK